jgi:hypothetical protein
MDDIKFGGEAIGIDPIGAGTVKGAFCIPT